MRLKPPVSHGAYAAKPTSVARPSSFLDHLKRTCPRDISRVIKGITRTLAISYQEDGSRMTAAETTRRFEICLGALELMTMDHGYSLGRGIDCLQRALRAQLDGAPWTPETHRSTWLAGTSGGDTSDPLVWTPERQRKGVISL